MASFFTLTLDTTAPGGVAIVLAGGAGTTSVRDITASISTTDTPTTGYQMKVWGDVDPAADANIQTTEGASAWVAYSTSQSLRLAAGDGAKTISVKVRDDVFNESGAVADSITLDTAIPAINVTVGPDVARISKVAGKDVASFTFSTNRALQAYKVKVVPADNSLDTAGTQIGTTAGSVNVSGGAVAAAGTVNVQIDGADLEAASAGDGAKIIKVFGQDASNGFWSV